MNPLAGLPHVVTREGFLDFGAQGRDSLAHRDRAGRRQRIRRLQRGLILLEPCHHVTILRPRQGAVQKGVLGPAQTGRYTPPFPICLALADVPLMPRRIIGDPGRTPFRIHRLLRQAF